MRAVALFLALLTACHAAVVDIADTYDAEMNSGKNLFVKFYAPWCGHCKRLAPDWNKLADEFADSSSVSVAEVDCTTDAGKEVCGNNEVRGYPTLKYFTPETGDKGESYQGARSFDDLKTFVQDKLESRCTVGQDDSCDEKELTYITKMKQKSAEDIEKEINRLTDLSTTAKMAADKKAWMAKRLAILKQL